MQESSQSTTGETPITEHKTGISWVWLIPLIGALVGGALIYDAFQNRGVDIVIQFEDAQGVEAKKTRVKYRNVDIGRVERIRFADDGQSILLDVLIDKEMQRFLTRDSQFWVVRPRIGTAGITGFSTLLSGAYINLEPGDDSTLTDSFVGLANPPLASPSEGGIKLELTSEGGKALNEGNPVLYRGFEVGVVEAVNFDVSERTLTYDIFIREPYDSLVTTNTYFYNNSGVTVSTNNQGLEVDFASMESLISGGVSFYVPDDLPLGNKIEERQSFKLYPTKVSTIEDRRYDFIEYVILVEDSVGGLDENAPVEYRGIKIGRVAKPYLGFHETNIIAPGENRIPVLIHIEPARLTQQDEFDLAWFINQFDIWIKTGLEASIETSNYLTGSLKVSLDMGAGQRTEVEKFGKYPVIPLGEDGFASIVRKTDSLLAKLNELDIESLLVKTGKTMDSANDSLVAIQALVEGLEATANEASEALKTVQPDSSLYQQISESLKRLDETMLRVQPLIDDIQQQPNLLVFPEPTKEDKQPKAGNK